MAKEEYLKTMRLRYRKLIRRADKTQMLNEICATTAYDRKYVIRFLGKRQNKGGQKPRKRGPKARYGASELKVLKRIWLASNLPGPPRLWSMLPYWLPGYQAKFGALEPELLKNLESISASSIGRLMAHTRLKHAGRGRGTTKPGSLLRQNIPIQTGQWEESRPGFIEADTVAHCGGSLAGEFVYTLDCVDIATGWTEQRALWSKTAAEVVKQMRSIENHLPFKLLGFDSDNGSEFINAHLFKHFAQRQRPVLFTRSRAYKKNDNAHIEQKNWTHVRQWLGYERIDNKKAVVAMNELYSKEWRLFHNFYCPSVKLISKTREGSKTIRKHDKPKTPYQRVLESEKISDYEKEKLTYLFENTNPFVLREEMKKKLKKVARLTLKSNKERKDGL